LNSAPESRRTAPTAREGRRPRRSWSRADKQRIVEEALRPGASVADVARRHGLNANQVFNWRRTALALLATPSVAELPNGAPACTMAPTEFIPIGVFARAADEAPPVVAGSASSTVARRASERAALPRPAMDERPGVIEIDLADGTRLRVDGLVNERALRRVLAVLKAGS